MHFVLATFKISLLCPVSWDVLSVRTLRLIHCKNSHDYCGGSIWMKHSHFKRFVFVGSHLTSILILSFSSIVLQS